MQEAILSALLLAVLASSYGASNVAEAKHMIGVNYGQLGSDLPPPATAVALMQHMGVGHVKIYDANPAILAALAGTRMTVAVMVTNGEVAALGTHQSAADTWVKHNVSVHYPATRIRTILVGNELLSDINGALTTWPAIVPAMRNLRRALEAQGLRHRVKVSTPLAMDMLQGLRIFPPSNATFRGNIREDVMRPLLRYLRSTRSSLFVDVYPYIAWANNADTVSLDFALFDSAAPTYADPGSGLVYGNLLDVQLDAVSAAMKRLGFEDVALTVSESGWPTQQGIAERGANIHNAALYNRRLVRKMLASPPVGTPRRPEIKIYSS